MAISCNESASCSYAPTDFNITQSFDDSTGDISVAVESCQLCGGAGRPFYCKNCAAKGFFYHSKSKKNKTSSESERFSEKIQKWCSLKRERLKNMQSIETASNPILARHTKKMQLHSIQEEIVLLKKAVYDARRHVKQDKEKLQTYTEENAAKAIKARRHLEKMHSIRSYISRREDDGFLLQHTTDDYLQKLLELRSCHVQQLQQHIFPITKVDTRMSFEAESLDQSTVSALAEARHTSYIRGRWVYTDHEGEQQYQIVNPSLPGNGDYSAYIMWLIENRELMANPKCEIGQRNPAYTISAALCYTAQLVYLVAYFLNISLPKRMCYSEFCGRDLTDRQFRRSVSRLNQNILHLCFSQYVDMELLQPHLTLQNILHLTHAPQLGRHGPFHVCPELLQSAEDVNGTIADVTISSSSSEEEEDETDFDQTESVEREWEQVPVTIPEIDSVCTGADSHINPLPYNTTRPNLHTNQTSNSIAGGLMSSAAASMASFWRAATGNKDK